MIRWNHTATVMRPVFVRGAYGTASTLQPVAAPGRPNARPDMTTQGTTHEAGGERQATNRRWFLRPDVRPTMGDVLEITTGPESPARMRVLSVVAAAVGARVRHYEVTTEQYTPEAA
jgi:hypothetical protein